MTEAPRLAEAMSERLPLLRAEVETQSVEFMREFPSNAHELGKEIAATLSWPPGSVSDPSCRVC
jgi:hypothetical protein